MGSGVHPGSGKPVALRQIRKGNQRQSGGRSIRRTGGKSRRESKAGSGLLPCRLPEILRTLSTVEVKPEVGGRLIATYFAEGDLVRKNQLLAEIDTVNYTLAYNQAEAALKVAQAGLERAQVSADHARTEKGRADNLLRSGGITEKDHQAALTGIKDAESQVRLAEAQCEQARAALAIAEKALKDCNIYSQTEGHVQKRYFDKGSLLTPGVSLYTIVDNNQLELECEVPSYQLAGLRLGQRATFQTPTYGERRFEGIVSAINPEVESENRSVMVKLKISNPRGELRTGMYARGEILTDREPRALVIPRDALIPDKEGSGAAGVYIVREGKAHRLDIQIGDSQLDQVWIRQGLREGDCGDYRNRAIPERRDPGSCVRMSCSET